MRIATFDSRLLAPRWIHPFHKDSSGTQRIGQQKTFKGPGSAILHHDELQLYFHSLLQAGFYRSCRPMFAEACGL